MTIAVAGVIAMLALGVVVYDLDVEAAKVPAAVATFLIGVSAFAALGMALAAVVKSASSASAAANVIILPLAFVSSVFVELDDAPRWLEVVGDVFPLKPFVESFQACFNPTVAAPGSTGRRWHTWRCGGSPGSLWRSNGSVGSRAVRRLAVVCSARPPRAEARPQENTTVLRPCTSTRCSTCAWTARANTIVSRSRPFAVSRFTSSRWVTWAVSCSMIGPSSRSAVA